jgi:two-component system, sensor histidine kinase and response regulator
VSSEKQPQPKVRILAVDDVEENLMALEALLDRPDVELLSARSAEHALELLLDAEVAIALVDVQMPRIDGFELAELMRGSPRTRRIPIIFLTAGPRDPTRMFRGYEAGAVDFLYKPLDPQILRSKIDVFIELHQQRAQLAQQVSLLQNTIRVNETFAAVLGHDLRGPLSAVITGTELLRRNPESERVERVANRIFSSATRMSRMIDQLLDFARVRHHRVELNPAQTHLDGLVERILLEQGEGGTTPGVAPIRFESLGDTHGRWDVDRLLQVLANLVGNARRHGDPTVPISIRLDGSKPSCVAIEVENGGAIDPDLMPRIFEPFLSSKTGSKTDGRTEHATGGLGLGLYIVKEVVEAHGGTVTVRSDTARGTCFRVELPRLDARAAEA